MTREELSEMKQLRAHIEHLQSQVDDVDKQVDMIERRLDVMQVKQDGSADRVQEMALAQKEIDKKIDLLVDRVADTRLENYKSGLIAALVAGVIQAFGWHTGR